jgi:hypothetical protein
MAEWVAVIISAVSAGGQARQAQENKAIAKEQEERQIKQQRLQESLDRARTRRQNRIRAAQVSAAAAASGTTGSLQEGAEVSRETFAETQAALTTQQGALQREQIELGTDVAISRENAAITDALATFTSDIFGPTTKVGSTGKQEQTTLFDETFGGVSNGR